MIDVRKILYEICENENVFDENIDLIESGILDSYGIMELLAELEDNGIMETNGLIFSETERGVSIQVSYSHVPMELSRNLVCCSFWVLYISFLLRSIFFS